MPVMFAIPTLAGIEPIKPGDSAQLDPGLYDATIDDLAAEASKSSENPGENLIVTFRTAQGTMRKWYFRSHKATPGSSEATLFARKLTRLFLACGVSPEQLAAVQAGTYDLEQLLKNRPCVVEVVEGKADPKRDGKIYNDLYELVPSEAAAAKAGMFSVKTGFTTGNSGAGTSGAGQGPAHGSPTPGGVNPFAGGQGGGQGGGMMGMQGVPQGVPAAQPQAFGGVPQGVPQAGAFPGQAAPQAGGNPFAQAGGIGGGGNPFAQANGQGIVPAALAGIPGVG